jgi:hypothetical protein
MADDDETQDAVRRILKERPPEDLPSGSEARLRQRLDKERQTAKSAPRAPRRAATARKRATPIRKKKS